MLLEGLDVKPNPVDKDGQRSLFGAPKRGTKEWYTYCRIDFILKAVFSGIPSTVHRVGPTRTAGPGVLDVCLKL